MTVKSQWHTCCTRSAVNADAKTQLHAGTVSDLEGRYGMEKVKGGVADLAHVTILVSDGNAADHHVSVSDGLHLKRCTIPSVRKEVSGRACPCEYVPARA